jgi:putative copper export protein
LAGFRIKVAGESTGARPCDRSANFFRIDVMQAEPLITWSEPVRELVGFLATFLAAGAIGFRYAAAGPTAETAAPDAEGSFYREGVRRAALLGFIGALIGLVLLSLALPDAAARHKVSAMKWLTTDRGTALQMIFAILLSLGLLLAWLGVRVGWVLAVIAIVGGAFQAAFVGRYAALINPIHRLAAGLWLGTLFVLLVCGLGPLLRHEELRERRGTIAASMVNRFSPLALTMGVVVVTFGVITAWRHLPTISALWNTPYGIALIVKLLLVALVFGLGGFNWRRQRPTLGSESAAVSLRRSARAEVTVAFLVLIATAIVVSLPSPKKPAPPPTRAPANQTPPP